jgi:hypothetical protein
MTQLMDIMVDVAIDKFSKVFVLTQLIKEKQTIYEKNSGLNIPHHSSRILVIGLRINTY